MDFLDKIINKLAEVLDKFVFSNIYFKKACLSLGIRKEILLLAILLVLVVLLLTFAQNFVKVLIALFLIFTFIKAAKPQEFECVDNSKNQVINMLVDLAEKKYNKLSEKEFNEFNRRIDQIIDSLKRTLDTLQYVENAEDGNRIYLTVTFAMNYIYEVVEKTKAVSHYPCLPNVVTKIEDAIGCMVFIKFIFNNTSDANLQNVLSEKVKKVSEALTGIMLSVKLDSR